MFSVETKINKSQFTELKGFIQKAPDAIKQGIEMRWNLALEAFKRLMQDKHLEGGTTVDRLARRSSNLYNSLVYEVKITARQLKGSVWFLPAVGDYAPTHEHGDPSRGIPPRMNLINEWDRYEKTLLIATQQGIKEGLQNA